MITLSAGELDKRIRIERPVPDTTLDGAGRADWVLVAEVWAGVRDQLPGKAEQLAEGMRTRMRQARVRIRFRDDIDATMRFVLGSRIMEIIGGPAELGRRAGLEFLVADYTPTSSSA